MARQRDEPCPILRYERRPAAVYEHDPGTAEVAAVLAARITAASPGTPVEHVGSTAVPGLPGKGIVDLLVTATPADIPTLTRTLRALGFQPQSDHPSPFPPTRPMLQGAIEHGGRHYRTHVHVVPAGDREVRELLGFRDALRRDPALCRAYAERKRAIVDGGTTDALRYTDAKSGWIDDTLRRLGLRPGRQPGHRTQR